MKIDVGAQITPHPNPNWCFSLKASLQILLFLAAPKQWHLAIARDVFPSCTDIFFLSTVTKIKRLDPDCMDKLEELENWAKNMA